MNRHNAAWSNEREEQLRGLWAEGLLSCSQIAARIGGTRNSIIGKVHRLGLAGRAPVPPPQRRARLIPYAGSPVLTRPEPEGHAMTQPSPPMRPEPDPLVCTTPLLDLATHGCRWPDGEGTMEAPYLFCGAHAVEGSSYCRLHRGMAVRGMAVSETHRCSAEQRSALACRLRAQRTNQSNAAKLNMVGEMPTIEEL